MNDDSSSRDSSDGDFSTGGDSIPEELRDSFDAYLDGARDIDAMRDLERRLREDAALRRAFVLYAKLDTDIRLAVRAELAGDRALDRVAELALSAHSAREPDGARRRKPAPRRFGLRTAIASLATAAGVALIVLALPRGESIAWIVNAQNCAWAGAEPAGDLRAGSTLALDAGLVEIRFGCGATVVVEGPAELELRSASCARLARGRLSAVVPHTVSGFEVISPRGTVVDLGTEFGVFVSDDGSTEVCVFDGEVEARHGTDGARGPAVRLRSQRSARITETEIAVDPADGAPDAAQFVRSIRRAPAILPRVLRVAFGAGADGISDAVGCATGLTNRLPGTGVGLPALDPNLRVDADRGQLELTTTRSDINHQQRLERGEYLGVRLADFGFTGDEDFAVSATVVDIPALEDFGQFGLYAGSRSDRNIRGGLIRWGGREPGQNTQFLVNNDGGPDSDVYKVGLLSPGADLRLTLERIRGRYSLSVENLSAGGASVLTIRHPAFLDGERDLHVGIFGANPYSDIPKTVVIREFEVTVWTLAGE